ncbi:hypothetical protein [Limosilactobacillus reuteri]|uniref:hypothetical protein n=1 Tax=Limosilactobacillus reuteri TaxID=1598 RepID=UPI001C5BCAA1|nr:hypothetical protein [Limosilactobacillus reuteri]MBW3350675.1 hypothetical protein [Limosilactobacillus reuteri]UUW69717.1 hypothetical protein NUJ10_11810 [Limosilactobacillus reuteri]
MSKSRRKHHEFICMLQKLAKREARSMDNKGQGTNYGFASFGNYRYRGTEYRGIQRYLYELEYASRRFKYVK